MLKKLRSLYKNDAPASHRFRYALLGFDLITIAFVVGTSFVPRTAVIGVLDVLFGAIILADFLVRLRIETPLGKFLLRPATWADIVAILSFLAPVLDDGFGFLRILRTLRLLRTYELLSRLRVDFPYFRRNEAIILAAVNLSVFLFIMTGLIYALQHETNDSIGNYADALYFTVTTLTTTGFGDITLHGTSGRMLSVAVMIFGVTLFLRLAQVLFRPPKVRQVCAHCGLILHDADAVHCKHCGATIHIRTEGRI